MSQTAPWRGPPPRPGQKLMCPVGRSGPGGGAFPSDLGLGRHLDCLPVRDPEPGPPRSALSRVLTQRKGKLTWGGRFAPCSLGAICHTTIDDVSV